MTRCKAYVVGLTLLLYLLVLSGCSEGVPPLPQPFERYSLENIFSYHGEKNPTGDGETWIVWRIIDSDSEVLEIIRDNEIWEPIDNVEFSKLVNYLSFFPSFKLIPVEFRQELYNSVAFLKRVEVLQSDRGFEYAIVWIYVPESRTLFYFAAKG